jgi:hypothetical protein
MYLAHVADIPGPHSCTVVVGHGLSSCGKLGFLGIKRIAIGVIRTANRLIRGNSIRHVDCILRTIDICVDSKTKKMLVVMRIDTLEFEVVSYAGHGGLL